MSKRFAKEQEQVSQYLPTSTRHHSLRGKDVWIFKKNTEVGVVFEIALFYDPDEDPPGYCAQLLHPKIEAAWQTVHVGHLWPDGVICLGGASFRTRKTLMETFSKSCLWAEGMAIMIQSQLAGRPSEFPFSKNNNPNEVE
jgi:hypothetical protein